MAAEAAGAVSASRASGAASREKVTGSTFCAGTLCKWKERPCACSWEGSHDALAMALSLRTLAVVFLPAPYLHHPSRQRLALVTLLCFASNSGTLHAHVSTIGHLQAAAMCWSGPRLGFRLLRYSCS